MGNKLKKKAKLQVVPTGPISAPPELPPTPPLHRPVATIQQEGLNLMSVIGGKHYQIRKIKAEIALLESHADKLEAEGQTSQAYYALQDAKAKQQQEQPK